MKILAIDIGKYNTMPFGAPPDFRTVLAEGMTCFQPFENSPTDSIIAVGATDADDQDRLLFRVCFRAHWRFDLQPGRQPRCSRVWFDWASRVSWR